MTTRSSYFASASAAAFLMILAFAFALAQSPTRAQEGKETDAPAALASVISAACRANQTQFAAYLTTDSAVAFHALPDDQRIQLIRRFALSESSGRPLISSDAVGHTVVRCETPEATIEFRFGAPRVRENLAFIPVKVIDGQENEFGLVRESGGWRLLSLGLVLIDIPQLAKQWSNQNLDLQESAAIDALRGIADAVETYRRAYGNMPNSLAQLGPADKNDVSPDKASLVNDRIAAGAQGGYHFRYRIAPGGDLSNPGFELIATPDEYGKTGRRSFFYDAAGKIHAADKEGGMAAATDPPLPDEKPQ